MIINVPNEESKLREKTEKVKMLATLNNHLSTNKYKGLLNSFTDRYRVEVDGTNITLPTQASKIAQGIIKYFDGVDEITTEVFQEAENIFKEHQKAFVNFQHNYMTKHYYPKLRELYKLRVLKEVNIDG